MMKANKYLKSQAFFLVLSTVFFTPSIAKNLRFRLIQSPMSIHINSYEPPKLAFQEALQKKNKEELADLWKEIENKPSVNLNEIQNQRKKRNPSVEIKAEKIQVSEMKFSRQEAVAAIQEKEWIKELPQQLQNRIQIADQKSGVLEQNWNLPTWKDFAEDVLKKNQAQPATHSPAAVYRKNSDGSRTTPENMKTAGVSLMSADESQTFKVSGQVRLLDGLALGDRQILIRRFENGIPKELASINLMKGTFEINVESKSGSLIAELTEANGEIVASGKESISADTEKIDLIIKDQNIFAGTFYNFNKSPELLMSEKFNSMRGQKAEFLITALQTEDNTDASGSFKVRRISENSASILRAKAPGFAETMMTMISGSDKNIPIFPEPLVQALRSLVNEEKKFQNTEANGSVIWGQVVFDGKPLQGVTVRILNDEESHAVYLNGWLPDFKVTETTKNGYFFFTDVPKGMQTLIVEKNGIFIAHANVEVDELTTSVAFIEATMKNKLTPVRVFDIFSGEALTADLQMQSLNETQAIQGQKDIYLPQLNRLSFGYAQNMNEDYFPTQFEYFDGDEFIHVPLMKKQVLASLATLAKINRYPDTGIIIGTVPEDDFDVYLTHEENFEKNNILYFDAAGTIIDHGVMGGGFILFNVPPKTQSVVVVSAKTNMIHSKLIPIEPNTTSVLTFQF